MDSSENIQRIIPTNNPNFSTKKHTSLVKNFQIKINESMKSNVSAFNERPIIANDNNAKFKRKLKKNLDFLQHKRSIPNNSNIYFNSNKFNGVKSKCSSRKINQTNQTLGSTIGSIETDPDVSHHINDLNSENFFIKAKENRFPMKSAQKLHE